MALLRSTEFSYRSGLYRNRIPETDARFRPDAYPYYKPNERENPKINPSAPVIEAISWRSDPGLW